MQAEREVRAMGFFKSKAGILVVLACLAVIAAVVWFTVSGQKGEAAPEGTLVEWGGGEAGA